MSLSKNDLGITSIDELVSWTSSYVHFKQALEVVTWTPDQAVSYLNAFPDFRERFAKELTKQGHLEARLPKAMRDKIAADKPNFEFIKTVCFDPKRIGLLETGSKNTIRDKVYSTIQPTTDNQRLSFSRLQ